MQTLKCIKGKIKLPNKYDLTKENRRLSIKTPWSSSVETLLKNNYNTTIQKWFRQKGKDKPFIPEGFIELNKVRFKVEEEKLNE